MLTYNDTKILVAVLTYKREEALIRCLASVSESAGNCRFPITIAVGDNDPEAVNHRQQCLTGIEYFSIGKKSVIAGRQELLRIAREQGYDLLIFVDDDEEVAPTWLQSLISAAFDYECAAVAGPVFPTCIPDKELPLHSRYERATGTHVPSAGAGNLLLKLDVIRGLDFDDRWPLEGGEDTDLTWRIVKSGGVIVWCNEAVVYEPVIASRRSKIWLMRRYFSNGRILFTVKDRNGDRSGRLEVLARFLMAVFAVLLFPLGMFSNSLFRLVLDKSVRNFGFIYQWLIGTNVRF